MARFSVRLNLALGFVMVIVGAISSRALPFDECVRLLLRSSLSKTLWSASSKFLARICIGSPLSSEQTIR